MPKSHRGGQASTVTPPAPPVQQDDDNTPNGPRPTPNQLWQEAQKNGTIDMAEHGYTIADLQSMNDDDMHDMILAISKQELPDYLMPNQMQKFTYALNMNNKPLVEDDATFTKNSKGSEIIYNAQSSASLKGFTLTADDIHDFIKYGDETLMQNGVYGNGLYFSNSRRGSASYGTRQSRARLNPATAKVITGSQLKAEYDAWIKSRPRTRRALGAMKANNTGYGTNTYSQFAALKGYNVIKNQVGSGEYYYTILDRGALIYSAGTKNSTGSNTW